MSEQFATPRFLRLPEAKREAIIDAALGEFSEHGFDGANTNKIAARAGVSVGALFKYFTTKNDLFRFLISQATALIEDTVEELLAAPLPVMEKIEKLCWAAVKQSREHRGFVALYHELSTIGNRELASDLASKLEAFTAEQYARVLKQAQEDGEISGELPPALLAFILDSLLMTLQSTATSEYYRDRLVMFAGDVSDEELIDAVMTVVAKAIGVS